MPSCRPYPRRNPSIGPALRPLALGLALALASGNTSANGPAWDVLANDPASEPWSREAFLAESAIPRGHPAAAGIQAALERVVPDRPAGAITVSNCNDSGAGSLRQAFADAVSGDTIDLTQLACSEITLTTGALATGLDSLALVGPGLSGLTSISAAHNSSIIVHTGNGVLDITGLNILNGGKYTTGATNALGGCINSFGNVRLRNSSVKYCVAQAQGTGVARGGAIRAAGHVALYDSMIAGNAVVAASGDATGGGVVAAGSLLLERSTVRDNTVETGSTNPLHGRGSGVVGYGNTLIGWSTISGNSAPQGGAVLAAGTFGTHEAFLTHSTVANNVGTRSEFGAGVRAQTNLELLFATITGNREIRPSGQTNKYGGGVTVAGGVSIQSHSSVISGNVTVVDGIDNPSDVGRKGFSEVGFSGLTEGVISFVGWVDPSIAPPGDWWRSSTPRLRPLAANGGPTWTMLPEKGSLLINVNPLSTPIGGDGDQRGPEFDRFVGKGLDIGAVETDTLFANGLEFFIEM